MSSPFGPSVSAEDVRECFRLLHAARDHRVGYGAFTGRRIVVHADEAPRQRCLHRLWDNHLLQVPNRVTTRCDLTTAGEAVLAELEGRLCQVCGRWPVTHEDEFRRECLSCVEARATERQAA